MTKVLYWKDKVHYRRPNDHPDVKEWEEMIRTQTGTLYHIEEEEDENG